MQAFGKWLGRGLLALLVGMAVLWFAVPRSGVDRTIAFSEADIPADPEGWITAREQQFTDIRPGDGKRIIWAGAKGEKTPLAIVYVHGFSAGPAEIRPVPDEVARNLGANLFFTRLAGHGRDGKAMATASAEDWLFDVAEAMAIGRRLGDRVVVIGTSTGGTLAALAATDPALNGGLAGTVLISPNFGVQAPAQWVLDAPFIESWGDSVAGETRRFTPLNVEQGRHWTTEYPTASLYPMARLVRAGRAVDYGQATTPALFLYAPADQVIDPDYIPPVIDAWGGPTQVELREMQGDDDPLSHVIAGDIMSPGQTEAVIAIITDWARRL
ncbi:MAG: alpha/beta fold hydrolase [Fuscovulum sp.]|nr:MAG: alpha/beta fold hydrolase [Fuscovulum sp.]